MTLDDFFDGDPYDPVYGEQGEPWLMPQGTWDMPGQRYSQDRDLRGISAGFPFSGKQSTPGELHKRLRQRRIADAFQAEFPEHSPTSAPPPLREVGISSLPLSAHVRTAFSFFPFLGLISEAYFSDGFRDYCLMRDDLYRQGTEYVHFPKIGHQFSVWRAYQGVSVLGVCVGIGAAAANYLS